MSSYQIGVARDVIEKQIGRLIDEYKRHPTEDWREVDKRKTQLKRMSSAVCTLTEVEQFCDFVYNHAGDSNEC